MLSVNMALVIFPTDAAEELKLFAEKNSLWCAKLRCRRCKREDADNDKSEAEKHFGSFTEKCEGLLSDKSCQDIESIIEYSGKHKEKRALLAAWQSKRLQGRR